MLTLRMWGEPQLRPSAEFDVPGLGRVVAEPVEWTPEGKQVAQKLTLVSCDVPGDDVSADLGKYWSLLGWGLNCLAFCRLSPLHVTLSRVEPAVVQIGGPAACKIYVGLPPPLGELSLPVGFPHRRRDAPPPAQVFREQVRAAMGWFIRSLEARGGVERMVFLWIALEALASNPKPGKGGITKAISAYVGNVLPAYAKDMSRLYDLRSRLVHGSLERVSDTALRASDSAMVLTHIVIECLKKEMAWPSDEAPLLLPDGQHASGIHQDVSIRFNSEVERKWPLTRVSLTPIEGDQ